MKHKPMKAVLRWAYVEDGEFQDIAALWHTRADAVKAAGTEESVQRVEIRPVPKKGKR